jgi:hypothetical protein
MFFGEMVQYYISEEYANEVQVTESSRFVNNDVYSQMDESRYSMLNQMMISYTLQDEEELTRGMRQYVDTLEASERLFRLL